jgi:multiple sugar transport system substrate-binding protein
MKSKNFLFLLLCALLIGSIPGCGKQESNQSLHVLLIAGKERSAGTEKVQIATDMFQLHFPKAEVSFEKIFLDGQSESEQENLLKGVFTSLMAGNGPDVLCFDSAFCESYDLYKMQTAGAFADVLPFMENDPDFQPEDYNMAVLHALQNGEHQYILPTYYRIPAFVTYQKRSVNGLEEKHTSEDVLETIETYYHNAAHENAALFWPKGAFEWFHHFMELNLLDYSNATANLDSELFLRALDGWKLTNPTKEDLDFYLKNRKARLTIWNDWDGDRAENRLLTLDINTFCSALNYAGQMQDEAVITPFPDTKGKIQAWITNGAVISKESKNKENAWAFLKILLQEEIQTDRSVGSIPVNRNSWRSVREEFNKVILQQYPVAYDAPFAALQDQVGGAFLTTPADKLIFDGVTPYLLGEKEKEEVLQELSDKLMIYISE